MSKPKAKAKPKLKQRPFFIWRPDRPSRSADLRRCRYAVRRIGVRGTLQCACRVEVWFDHPDEKAKIGACIDHNPFAIKKLTPAESTDRNLAGRISRYRDKKATLKDDVAACAIEWEDGGRQHEDLDALGKATQKYLRHENKGEPKR